MNLTLRRTEFKETGIFGELLDTSGKRIAYTIEHAYPKHIGSDASSETHWEPKIPAGQYTCEFGPHRLHSGPISTYEVKGVPGHKGILFHVGNTQKDSEGCILLGISRDGDSIGASRTAFADFLALQKEEPFQLTVGNA